jgi:hypothetical protein
MKRGAKTAAQRELTNPPGKKAVASDEWFVARNGYKKPRFHKQTLKPHTSGSVIHKTASYHLPLGDD